MFIINLNKNNIPIYNMNDEILYNYELEKNILNIINTIYLNKDLFIITSIYILFFILIIIIPLIKKIKINKLSLILSITKMIMLSRII